MNKNILGYDYSLHECLDHLMLLHWFELIAHKIKINEVNINFDNREYIQLPSGKKIKITIKVEEYKK